MEALAIESEESGENGELMITGSVPAIPSPAVFLYTQTQTHYYQISTSMVTTPSGKRNKKRQIKARLVK